MSQKITSFCAAVTFLAIAVNSQAAESKPVVSLSLNSFEKLISDVAEVSTAMGQDSALMEAQAQAMIGPGVMALIDQQKPWHVALWMESLEADPVWATFVPASDFPAFETALQSSMIGMFQPKLMDAGDYVVLYGSKAGLELAPENVQMIESYAANVQPEAKETLELEFNMIEPLRAMALQAMMAPKAQMMAAFDTPEMAASGISAESMQEMMAAYFSVYESIVRDLNSLTYSFGVRDSKIVYAMDIMPTAGSGTAEFLKSQAVPITDLAPSVRWDSDMAFMVGMDSLPESWNEPILALLEGVVPIYGLEASAATEWLDAMQKSLPLKSAFSMNFKDGISYFGFYEIMEGSATEVYNQWIKITEQIVPAELNAASMYSDISIVKDARKESGHSVDVLTLTLNPEHVTMQIPEQKEYMESMFPGGKLTYEMCLVGDRIYMASEGDLPTAMKTSTVPSPVELNAGTRVAGSMNLISMMKLTAEVEGYSESYGEFADMVANADPVGAEMTFAVDLDDSLMIRGTWPLKLISIFSQQK